MKGSGTFPGQKTIRLLCQPGVGIHGNFAFVELIWSLNTHRDCLFVFKSEPTWHLYFPLLTASKAFTICPLLLELCTSMSRAFSFATYAKPLAFRSSKPWVAFWFIGASDSRIAVRFDTHGSDMLHKRCGLWSEHLLLETNKNP